MTELLRVQIGFRLGMGWRVKGKWVCRLSGSEGSARLRLLGQTNKKRLPIPKEREPLS